MPEPEFNDVIGAALNGMVDGGSDVTAIVLVHKFEKAGLRPIEASRFEPEQLLEFATPPDLVRRQIPRPYAHRSAAHRQCQDIATLSKRRLRLLASGDIREEDCQTGRRGVDTVFEPPVPAGDVDLVLSGNAVEQRGLEDALRVLCRFFREDFPGDLPDELLT